MRHVLVLMSMVLGWSALPAHAFTSLVNFQCMDWTITGPCVCNLFTPCVAVEYWEPGWLVETVKIPGTTVFDPLAPLLGAALGAFGIPEFGGGGAGNATDGHTNLQYNEVHVYTFPNLLGTPCTGWAPSTSPVPLHYASEADPTWRTATATPSPCEPPPGLGVWARSIRGAAKRSMAVSPWAVGLRSTRPRYCLQP